LDHYARKCTTLADIRQARDACRGVWCARLQCACPAVRGSEGQNCRAYLIILHITFTCAIKPGCLMCHKQLHTPDCTKWEMKYNGLPAQSRPVLCLAYATTHLSQGRPEPEAHTLAGIMVQYVVDCRFAASVSSAYIPGELTSCFSTLAARVHWQHFVIPKQLGDVFFICTQHIVVECP